MLPPIWKKNDRKASVLIIAFSLVIFTAIIILSRVKLEVNLGFDVHWFARLNAMINSIVTVLLIGAMIAIKKRKYLTHKKMMLASMILSILFLVSYICHHLFAGETRFGDINHDGVIDEAEKAEVGFLQVLYRIILFTHIPLAGIILPFILFTAYRSMIGEYERHKRLGRITWPVWLYVAITGVIVYVMISPYYA
jgi:putative membrane protein